jgi:hypothetical protein
VFEDRVVRRIFGTKEEKQKGNVIWRCRKLHTEELNSLYLSPNIRPTNDKTEHVARMRKKMNKCKNFVWRIWWYGNS